MTDIEDRMVTCPLKQNFRDKFWLPYIEKLAKKPVKYLTLYCPPAMDIRHFCEKGLIEFKDGVYRNVVGVAWNAKGYIKTANNLEGRLEKFKIGQINDLLGGDDKDLVDRFPFDVINLDYCNHLVNNYVSGNVADIDSIVSIQKNKACEKFVLFITTRTDKNSPQNGFPNKFIKHLDMRIKSNIHTFPDFKDKYNRLFNSRAPSHNEFLLIGIVKYISNILAENDYFIKECSAAWLIRNNVNPKRDLLHLAFLVSLRNKKTKYPKNVYEYGGGSIHLEPSAARILEEMLAKRVYFLNEKTDRIRLEKKYGAYLVKLKETNFELLIPLPIG